MKLNKKMSYRTGDLYYQFNADEGNFENLYETLSANLNIYKQDVKEELELNDDLYYKNLDGSITISIYICVISFY